MRQKSSSQQPQSAQPISISQARRSRRRRPGTPSSAPSAPVTRSAAERLAERAWLKERAELVGHLDPYHAYRAGFGQGSITVLSALEQILAADIDLDTALYELRAWLMGEDFKWWINAPDDPHEITPGAWLERRRERARPHEGPPSA